MTKQQIEQAAEEWANAYEYLMPITGVHYTQKEIDDAIAETAEVSFLAGASLVNKQAVWEEGWKYCQKMYVQIDDIAFRGSSAYQCMKRDFADFEKEGE